MRTFGPLERCKETSVGTLPSNGAPHLGDGHLLRQLAREIFDPLVEVAQHAILQKEKDTQRLFRKLRRTIANCEQGSRMCYQVCDFIFR